jgi:xanthine dehydrogenase accessory factor
LKISFLEEDNLSVKNLKVLIRSGGELASALACRLAESHFDVIMTELALPTAVRRNVSFCEAVYEGRKTVEGRTARLVRSVEEALIAWEEGEMALIVDPDTTICSVIRPDVEVDAIIAKRSLGTRITDAELVIGLGIGFEAGKDVHVVIETNRGHNLGRVMRKGLAEPDTGDPGNIGGYTTERVMRSPRDGIFKAVKELGDMVKAGDIVAYVGGEPVKAAIPGIIRGLLRDGTPVTRGLKAGDVDPRANREYCYTISDKGRTISGGVIEAIMAHFNA